MRRPLLRALLALIAPPAEARMRDLVIEPRASDSRRFALDAAQRRQQRALRTGK